MLFRYDSAVRPVYHSFLAIVLRFPKHVKQMVKGILGTVFLSNFMLNSK